MVQLGTFVLNLEDEVEVIYNLEAGSGKEFVGTGIPSKVSHVCFTDPSHEVNLPPIMLDQLDPLLEKHLSVNTKYQLYIVPTEAYPSPSPNFVIDYLSILPDENPLCFAIVDGVLRMVLQSKLVDNQIVVLARRS